MTVRNMSRERLQLLVTFKAIYENRSISLAADALGVTQSATSKHLQKLREWFEDDLFVRTASGMEPTGKAVAVIERVDHILQEMVLLTEEVAFDPASLQGVFTIATTSEMCRWLTPELLKVLSKKAPKLRITVINLTADYSIRELETGKVDLVISVNWHAPDVLMQKRLFDDHFVCLMSQQHPLADGLLDLTGYAEATHVMVAPLGKLRGFIDDQLIPLGLKRHVRLSIPDFSQLEPHLLDGDHIVTLPSRIAEDLQRQHSELVIRPMPFDVPRFNYYVFWHRRFHDDPANQWMRREVLNILSDD